jgi:hypothetical protein
MRRNRPKLCDMFLGCAGACLREMAGMVAGFLSVSYALYACTSGMSARWPLAGP